MIRTLEQKVGQLMLVGWQTTDVNDIIENIKRYNFGNIILFTRNILSAQHLKDNCDKIQETALEYNGTPCFIALDQEGGNVRRIYNGVTNTPGAMAIAAASAKYPEAAALIGNIMGQELKSLGINLNLAPVVDINSNPYNPIIAIRSFGDDPFTVKKLASDFAQAQQNNGIMSCFKHFLGHGAVDIDSHIDLPRVDKTLEELRQLELIPYIGNDKADAVMTSHILFEKIDNKFPASISEIIIKKILRGELNFGGLVISDCFEMEGLIQTFSFEEAAIFALNASTDIITVSHTFGRQLTVRNAIMSAIKSGKLSEEKLSTALMRIDNYKKKYCLEIESNINYQKNQSIAEKISNASITVASGEPFEINQNVVIIGVTNYVSSTAEDVNVERMDIAKIIGEEFGIEYRSIDNKNFNANEMLSFARGKKVILALSDSHLTLIQKVLYSTFVQANFEIMLISLRTPYDILDQEMPHCHICIYGYTALSIRSLIRFLHCAKAEGRLPVNIGKYSDLYIRENTSTNIFLDNVINYLKQNFGKKLSLENVAEKFLISGGHLCKLMKRKLNKNFVDVLNEIRIGESKRLLNSTNLKVYEIANLCGYADINYFSRLFKKFIGITPSYYRQNFSLYD